MALDKLKIIRLEAENVKRLVAVDIKPNGDLVEITGKNGHGKTSVLDSILWAMGGERQIQWKPIREGEEKAHIKLSLGDENGDLQLVVLRRFTAKDSDFTTTLTVTNAEGFQPKGAQTLLNTIVGALSFDPGEFVRAKPAEQISILKGVISSLDPDVDFDRLEKDRKKLFDERTDEKREAQRLRSQGEGIVLDERTPAERVSTADLEEAMRNAGASHREFHRLREEREALAKRLDDRAGAVETGRRRVLEFRKEADEIEEAMNYEEKAIAKARAALEAETELVEPEDTAELSEKLDEARALNRLVDQAEYRKSIIDDADERTKHVEALTAAIKKIDDDMRRIVEDADLPVSGLEITPETVMLRGVPFAQASDAEQLRASMAIGMAANPRLRVIRVRDGSLLDEDALKVVREVAGSNGFQIWMERVGAGGPEAIVMENGNVKL